MSNGSKPQGQGLSAPCIGCLIIGLVIGLFAGAFLPTLFSGGTKVVPATQGSGAAGPREELPAEVEEDMVDEPAEAVDETLNEDLEEEGDEEPGAEGEGEGAEPDSPAGTGGGMG